MNSRRKHKKKRPIYLDTKKNYFYEDKSSDIGKLPIPPRRNTTNNSINGGFIITHQELLGI